MGAERYSHSGQRLPTHEAHADQRRYPSTGRLIKYGILAFFAFFAIGLLHGKRISPSVSSYLPISVDGAVDVLETAAPAADHESSNPFESLDADGDHDREPPASEDNHQEYNLSSVQQTSATSPYPKFGKCTASFGDPDPPYESAIASHNLHNEIHGYPHYILREHMIRGLWSKHGWIMTIIGNELAKPEDQRLKWLMWHDRDTVLMNPQIPLDVFVPPEPQFSHIHMLVTNDRNGLNNGVFLVRVNQWAFKFFASALSIREYQPEIPLKYTEQSGMEEVIKRVRYACILRVHAPANAHTALVGKICSLRSPTLVQWFPAGRRRHSRSHSRTLASRLASNPFRLEPRRLAS
jgi:hypothetical protein